MSTLRTHPNIKPDYCPGCGSKFQTVDNQKPGYLVVPSTTPKKPTIKTNSNELNNEDVEKIIRLMPDDVRKKLYPEGEITHTSSSELMEKQKDERIFCHRCYNLLYYNRVTSDTWQESLTTDKSILSFLKKKDDAIIVTVVDIFDFPGSLLEDLDILIGTDKQNILVANKMDLLPNDVNETRIKRWLYEKCKKFGLTNISDIFLISAKKNWKVQELAQTMSTIRSGFDDIYLIGKTNVGKSELINSFLRCMVVDGWRHKVTSSPIPGTTMGMLGLPLTLFKETFGVNPKGFHFPQTCRHLFDTPGIINENQLINLLTEEELKITIPQKYIKPLTFALTPGKTIFLEGLGRIDYVEGQKPIRTTVFSRLKPHITSIRRADEICQSMAVGDQTFLQPPIFSSKRKEFPAMIKGVKKYAMKGIPGTMSIKDVVFSGVGWISLGGMFDKAVIDIWSPNGIGIYIRDKPLLPFEFRGKYESPKLY
ncbi:ribosome biogenesis GTPase YqeH [Gigaspora margarita]|uniref:Ribosome biogenesis GTPase YqeH n=1 Tax=Gigaspora margarita TaxID=4874 RepID=A0A8H4A0P5_GIGMA|nr:ribosome biogenesis GTPase YqeH [Gigaspora margarita]